MLEKKKKKTITDPKLRLGDLVLLFLRHGPTMYPGWTGTYCIAQASLKLADIFLPLSPKC